MTDALVFSLEIIKFAFRIQLLCSIIHRRAERSGAQGT